MKLVILDRDGVINEDSDEYIKSVAEWTPIPGSLEAIALLCQAGYQVYIASNQSGIGRGLLDFDALFAIHERLQRAVAEVGGRISGIQFAPDHPDRGQRDAQAGARGHVEGPGRAGLASAWKACPSSAIPNPISKLPAPPALAPYWC